MRKVFFLSLIAVCLLATNGYAATWYARTTGNWSGNIWASTATGSAGAATILATDDVVVQDGVTLTLDVSPVTVANLTIGGGTSAIFTIGSNSTALSFTVTGNVTVSAGATLQPYQGGSSNMLMTIGGNFTIDGTLSASGGKNINFTFNGTAKQSLSGAGATVNFNTITLNNTGSTNGVNNVVEVSTSAFSVPSGFLTLTKGVFKLSGSFAFSNPIFATAAYTIPASAGIWLNNSNAVVTPLSGSPILTGKLQITAGTYKVGTVNNQNLRYATGSSIVIDGPNAILSVASRIQSSGSGTLSYSQSNGVVKLCTVANSLNGVSALEMTYSGSVFTMSGGTIIICVASTSAPSPYDWLIFGATTNITGGKLQLGTTGTIASTFKIRGVVPSLVIDNSSSNNPSVKLISTTTIKGDVTINGSGNIDLNGFGLTISPNDALTTSTITRVGNSGTFTGTPTFSSPVNVAYTGSTAVTTGVELPTDATSLKNLVVGNSGGVTLGASPTVTGATILNGTLNTGGNSISGGTLQLAGSSTIALSSPTVLAFANSTGASWDCGKLLTITGWVGSPDATGTNGQLEVGTDASGLSATQLGQIRFGTNSAAILSTGEVVSSATALSTVSTLSNLIVNTATLSPSFASGTTAYTTCVSNATSSITVTSIVTDATASVQVNSSSVCSGSPSSVLALNVGNNTITIVVSAQNGTTTTTYTITVTRAAAAPSITAGGTTTFCSGGSVTLTSSYATGNQWYKDGSTISGATSQTYIAFTTGAYTAVATDSCNSLPSNSISVSVLPYSTWTGAVSTDWSDVNNWCGVVPTVTTDVVIPGNVSNMPVIFTTGNAHDVTLSSGATLVVSGTINLYGSLSEAIPGAFDASGGSFYFMGSVVQTTPAFTASVVELNGTGGVSFGGAATITNSLTLTNGVVLLNNYNLTLGSNIVITGGSIASHVVENGSGVLKALAVNGTRIFPIGTTALSYSPVIITNSSGKDWTVQLSSTVPFTSNWQYNRDRAIQRSWEITPSAAPGATDLSFQYNTADANLQGASFDPTATVVINHYNSTTGAWELAGQTQSGAVGVNTISVTGWTTFSPFVIGMAASPLPVTLIKFTGRREGTINKLWWTTATESNNSGFRVQRSVDGSLFSPIGFVASLAPNGNSNYDLNYSFDDANAKGRQYYRLQQVDMDGRTKYSQIVVLSSDNAKAVSLALIYPDPVHDQLNIVIEATVKTTVRLLLTDVSGKLLKIETVNLEAGSNSKILDFKSLANGSYLVKLVNDDGSVNEERKVVKQ